jgi:hypothetical protein
VPRFYERSEWGINPPFAPKKSLKTFSDITNGALFVLREYYEQPAEISLRNRHPSNLHLGFLVGDGGALLFYLVG